MRRSSGPLLESLRLVFVILGYKYILGSTQCTKIRIEEYCNHMNKKRLNISKKPLKARFFFKKRSKDFRKFFKNLIKIPNSIFWTCSSFFENLFLGNFKNCVFEEINQSVWRPQQIVLLFKIFELSEMGSVTHFLIFGWVHLMMEQGGVEREKKKLKFLQQKQVLTLIMASEASGAFKVLSLVQISVTVWSTLTQFGIFFLQCLGFRYTYVKFSFDK